MLQKAIAEGGRSMIYECAKLADTMIEATENGDTKLAEKCDDRLGFLTPILKGFLTESGITAAQAGIQTWGGHGFIKENFQEQILRDVRIAALWEGTTQIQGLDLLGRKILLNKLKPINSHCSDQYKKLTDVVKSTSGATRSRALGLLGHVMKWQFNTYRLAKNAVSDRESVGVAAVDYLMYSGYITLACHYVYMEAAASKALASGSKAQEKGFYEAKIAMSEFVYNELLPHTLHHEKCMFNKTSTIMKMPNNDFSFDYTRL